MTDLTVLYQHVEALSAVAAQHARDSDVNGGMHPEVLANMRHSPLLASLLPSSIGGAEQGALFSARAIKIISSGCASSGLTFAWYIGFPWLMSQFPRQLVESVLVPEGVPLVSGALMPRGKFIRSEVDSGYFIQGSWPFASGAVHAEWVALAVGGENDTQNTAKDIVVAFVRVRDVRIDRHWDALGMRATESHGVVIDEPLFVPETNCRAMSDLFTGEHLPAVGSFPDSFRIPYDIMTLVGLSACAVGLLKSFSRLGAATSGHVLPEAGVKVVLAAEAKLDKMCSALDSLAAISFLDRDQAEMTRKASVDITTFCLQQIVMGAAGMGTFALYRSGAAERHVRDIVTLSSHVLLKRTPD